MKNMYQMFCIVMFIVVSGTILCSSQNSSPLSARGHLGYQKIDNQGHYHRAFVMCWSNGTATVNFHRNGSFHTQMDYHSLEALENQLRHEGYTCFDDSDFDKKSSCGCICA